MNLSEKLIKQCRKPTGFFGRIVLRSMNRGHKVAEWGLTHISIRPDEVILDVGCGGGKTVNRLAKRATKGKVYGVDYSEDSVKMAMKQNKKLIEADRVEIFHASVESLPFPDNFFNIVTAVETYYFWPNLIENLKEILRVLKPEGQLFLINEMYKHEKFEKRNAKWTKLGKFEVHSPKEFKKFLIDSGYTSVEIDLLEDKNWIVASGRKANYISTS
jgi:ubiquinone/menaquinone biosynthesis C-methylase UbiE